MKLWNFPVLPDDKHLFQCHVAKTAQHYAMIGGSILVLGPLLYTGIYNVAFSHRASFCDFFSSVCPHTDPCVVHHVHDDPASPSSSTPTASRPRSSDTTAAGVRVGTVESVSQSSPVFASVVQRMGRSVERMQYASTGAFARYVARTATVTFVKSSYLALAKAFTIDIVSHAATLVLCTLLDRATAGETTGRGGPAWLRALRRALGAGLFCVFARGATSAEDLPGSRTWYQFFCMATSLDDLVDFYVPCVHWARVAVRCFLAPGWTAVYRNGGGDHFPVNAEHFLSHLTPYGHVLLYLFARLQQELIPQLVHRGLRGARVEQLSSQDSSGPEDETEGQPPQSQPQPQPQPLKHAASRSPSSTLRGVCTVYVVAAVAPAVAAQLAFLQSSVSPAWRERIWTAPGPSYFLLGAVGCVPLCCGLRSVSQLVTDGR